MKTIANAEIQWKNAKYVTAATSKIPSTRDCFTSVMADLTGRALLSPNFANATAPANADKGYYFVPTEVPMDWRSTFGWHAVPARYNRSGIFTFYLGHEGVTFGSDQENAALDDLSAYEIY